MQITEDSSSCSMEFCEEDIKIEEVSIEDEGDYYSDATSCEDQFPPKSENMIFTQIYIPKEGAMQGYLASPSLSEMNFKNRPGRKQKLEHLSFEEKLLRKKLKNREAAQTSRDRKKARMTELELQVRYLQQQNERLRCEKDSVCKENERLKQELTHPLLPDLAQRSLTASHPTSAPRCSLAATHVTATPEGGNGKRVDPSIEQESAAFLEVSPQKTAGEMQRSTRPQSPTPVVSLACVANSLREEVLSMVSTVATLLLVVAMTTSGPVNPKTGTGSWILKRDHLQSAFSKLSSSQQVYLSQLLLIIAKELHQVPEWWGARQSSWNPVNFLHSNVPLFLRHLPPLPPPPHPSSPPVASLPSLSTLVEASMKKVPAALP